MGTLFIIGSDSELETAFRIARGIKEKGGKLILVFRGKGTRFIEHPHFRDETGFSDEAYVLRDGSKPCWGNSTKTISPYELVEMMESCERVVSWV